MDSRGDVGVSRFRLRRPVEGPAIALDVPPWSSSTEEAIGNFPSLWRDASTSPRYPRSAARKAEMFGSAGRGRADWEKRRVQDGGLAGAVMVSPTSGPPLVIDAA